MTKRCGTCGVDLPVTDFYLTKGKKGKMRRYPHCIPCAVDIQRVRQLRDKYGLTPEQYEVMVEMQEGCCAICLKPERVVRAGRLVKLGVDHCHVTGDNRGLLCRGCNIGLGNFRDDPDLLRNAATYVEFYSTLQALAGAPSAFQE